MKHSFEEFLFQKYQFPQDEWICANYIQSFSGNLNSPNCTSDTLSNPHDRMILRVIRSANDAVLIGAKTARVENIAINNKPLIIVTKSGNLQGFTPNKNTTVIAPRTAKRNLRKTLVALTDTVGTARVNGETTNTVDTIWIDDFDQDTTMVWGSVIHRAIKGLGFKKIVCEGGPELITTLLSAGIINELCISIVNKKALGPKINTSALHEPRLVQVLIDQKYSGNNGVKNIYTRWVLENRRGR